MGRPEALRVPLQPDDEALVGVLDRFHHAVGRPGHGHEPVPRKSDSLVVHRVHRQLLADEL